MKINFQRTLLAAVIAVLAASAPLFASETDAQITSSFNTSYVSRAYLKTDAIKVESKDGVVTLSGTVNDASHKGLAEETASNLPGVKKVDNRLELKAEYPVEQTNEWLAMKIKAALLFHRSVSAVNTEVYVEEGIVTLRGEAANEAQKELTSAYADVVGVQSIKNEMMVAKAPTIAERTLQEKIDDASITAQVKMALLTHRSTSVLNTSVGTKNGIVLVAGKAKNAAEKDLVTKLVSDIYGVNTVVNDMTVEKA